MKYFISILFIISILSCETLVEDIPLSHFPELKSKLVMSSFISPNDTAINVRITESTPLFGEFKTAKDGPFYIFQGDTIYYDYGRNDVIKTAIVKISDGTKSITIPYNSKTFLYSIPTNLFKIEAGKTYKLTAETSDKKVDATTTIPLEIVNIENIKIDTIRKTMDIYSVDSLGQYKNKKESVKGYQLQFEWKDVPIVNNYYRIYSKFEYYQELPSSINGKDVVYKKMKLFNNVSWSDQFYDLKAYFEDVNKNGTQILSPKGEIFVRNNFSSNGGLFINGKQYVAKPIDKNGQKLVFSLSNLSKELFDYQISFIKTINSDGNPFAEPIPIYTNVKNGLGCFAGFSKTEVEVNLK